MGWGKEIKEARITMKHQVVQFCKNCIGDVLSGEIEFTEPTIINEVPQPECMNNLVNSPDPKAYENAITYVDLD